MRKIYWFWLAITFLLINGYGVFRVTEYLCLDSRNVRVISVTPGEDQSLRDSDSIKFGFSSEMVAPDMVNRRLETVPARLSPHVTGEFCWDRPDRLKFIPSRPWEACLSLVVTLNRELTARDGRELSGPRVFEVRSEPLRILSADQNDIDNRRRVFIRLEFNSPVSPAALLSSLTINGPAGEKVDYNVEGKTAGKVVIIKTDSIPADWEALNLNVDEDLQSTAGPRGLAAAVRRKVPISEELALLGLKPKMNRISGGMVEASFSAPLQLEKALSFISFNPPVDLTIEEKYSYGSQSRYRIRGDFKPGRTYGMRLGKGMPGLSGPGLAEDINRNVYFPDRPPSLTFSHQGNYLSSAGSRLVPVTTVNISRFNVTIDRIYPNNLVQFAMREENNYSGYYGKSVQGLTKKAGTEEITLPAAPNKTQETMIDLGKYPGTDHSGAYWITIDSEGAGYKEHLVVVTDIGISVKTAEKDILVWVNSIRNLTPIANAEVRIYSSTNQEIGSGSTDRSGLAQIVLRSHCEGEEMTPFLVTVRDGDDISYLVLSRAVISGLEGPSGRPYIRKGYEAYLTTFRGVYRPGEAACISAIIRGSDLKTPSPFPVIFRLIRPDGKEDHAENVLLSEEGTATVEFRLPDYAMTGGYRVECIVPGSDQPIGKTSFLVEEFVPPRIEVIATADESRAYSGEDLEFTVSARHLFGSPAAGNPVQAWIEFHPEKFRPSQWPDYIFGDPEKTGSITNQRLGNSVLDEAGETCFPVGAPENIFPPAALRAQFGCTVIESGGRPVSAYTFRIVDPYPFYIGLRKEKEGNYYPAGEDVKLDVIAVGPEANLSKEIRELRLDVSRITYATVLKMNASGRYSYDSERQLRPIYQTEIQLQEGRGEVGFIPDQPGRYLVTVSDSDSGSSTSFALYAGSPDQEWIAWSMERPERVELSFDREIYRPGDTASLLIRSPFPGLALITVESDRVLDHKIIPLEKNTADIKIPVKSDYGPNVYCSVSVIRRAGPEAKWSPHRASGTIPLLLDNSKQRLEVGIQAPVTVRPREKLKILISVTDHMEAGVPARVALAAVDEGICDLSGFAPPDPFSFFLGLRSLGVKQYDIYSLLMPEIEPSINGSPSAPGGGDSGEEISLQGRINPVSARRFKPVALQTEWVETDAYGRVEVEFDLPEFTGELRMMVLAVAGDDFGAASKPVMVKRPLVVQSSLPRFLAPGDQCRMKVQVFNETGNDGMVRLEVKGSGGLQIEAAGRRVETGMKNIFLPAGRNEQVEFELISPPLPGLTVLNLRAVMGDELYEEETEMSIRPVSPIQTKSGIGRVSPGETVEFGLPHDWLKGTARYKICADGNPLIHLGENLVSLLNYPYGCIEQTTSTCFPLLYLADISARILPGAIGESECRQLVEAGIRRILSMQLVSGGFGYWPSTTEKYDWGSVYATHFLIEAGKAGYRIPSGRIESATGFLRNILNRPEPAVSDTTTWMSANKRTIKSYAALVLALAGKPEPGWTSRLAEEKEHLDRSGLLYLVAAFMAEGRKREALNILELLPMAVDSRMRREKGGCLRSKIRDQALELAIRLDIDLADPVIPILIHGLTGPTRLTTQENAMVLLALGKYCRYQADEPTKFSALISGIPDRKDIAFGENDECFFNLENDNPGLIRISNKGPGPVYYSWSSKGVPVTGMMKEADRGIIIRRRLLDNEGNEIEIAFIKQGEPVVVELMVDVGDEEVDNLVITDLLPAGLEIENAALNISRLIPWVKKKSTLPVRHTDDRDDRLIIFTGGFSGEKKFYYLLRAVTAGEFVQPPVTAECMYDPELRSVSGKGKISVKSD